MNIEENTCTRWIGAIWVIFALIWLGLMLLYYFHGPKLLMGDEVRYFKNGMHFANNLTIPKILPLWPPGYSYFVGVLLWIGHQIGMAHPIIIVQIVQFILLCFAGFLFWEISKVLHNSKVRLVAFGLFILNPTLIAYTQYLWPEIVHLTLYLGVIWIFVNQKISPFWYISLGLLLGLASLTKLVYLPISILIIIVLLFRDLHQNSFKPFIIFPLLVFLFAITPTIYQNYKIHGVPVIADSSVFNLWVGLSDADKSEYVKERHVTSEFRTYNKSSNLHKERNKILIRKIKDLVKEKGIVNIICDQLFKQYFRLFDHRTFLIKQLPSQITPRYKFDNGIIEKIILWTNGILWGLVLFGLGFGILDLISIRRSFLHLMLFFLIYNLGLFFILHVKTRFVIQMLPMLCLISALGYSKINLVFSNKKRTGVDLIKFVSGLFLSLLFLRLGFDSLI